jgi:hypothetical protein
MRYLIAALIWLGLALPAFAAPAKVQDCANVVVSSGANTVACTLGSSVTAKDMLVVIARTGCSSITSVADNNTNSYQVAAALQTGPGIGYYWVPTANSGSTTVTLTVPTSGCFEGLSVSEWSGMGLVPSVDTAGFATTTYTTGQTLIQSGVLNASGSAQQEVLIAGGITDSVQTPSGLVDYGSGGGTPTAFTNQGQTSSSGGETLVGGYQLVTSAAAYGLRWTVTSSPTAGMILGFIPTPPVTGQAIGPNGPGVGNICQYPPITLGLLGLYPVPAAGCQTVVENVGACTAGSAPSGSGSVQCPVCSNGSAWVGC